MKRTSAKIIGSVLLGWALAASPALAAVTQGNWFAGNNTSGSSYSFSMTVSSTSTNPEVLIHVLGATTDVVTNPTVNGVGSTLLTKAQNNAPTGRWSYTYAYTPTSTGNINIAITSGGSADFLGAIVSTWGGVGSTEASTLVQGGGTLATVNVTSTVNGAVLEGYNYNDAGSTTAGSGTYVITEDTNNRVGLASTVAYTPGTNSLKLNVSSGHWTFHAIALDPVTSGGTSSTTSTASTTGQVDWPVGDAFLALVCFWWFLYLGWQAI